MIEEFILEEQLEEVEDLFIEDNGGVFFGDIQGNPRSNQKLKEEFETFEQDILDLDNSKQDAITLENKLSYNLLKDTPSIPSKTSDLTNDSNFVSDSNYVHTDNNFTNQEKSKLAGLENYDDTALSNRVTQNETDINSLEINKAEQSDLDTLEGRVETAESNITSLDNAKEDKSVVSALSTRVTTAETNIYNLNANKENVSNKSDTLDDSSTKYPTNHAVKGAVDDVREIAQGKANNFVVTAEDNPTFDSTNDAIQVTSFVDINGVTRTKDDVKIGDNVYVQEIPIFDRWVSNIVGTTITLSRLETAKVPVTDVQDEEGTSLVTNGIARLVNYVRTATFNTLQSLVNTLQTALNTLDQNAVKGVKTPEGELEKDETGKVTIPFANSNGSVKGILSVANSWGFYTVSGMLRAFTRNYSDYSTADANLNISKGTLENVLNNETLRIDKLQSLTDSEKQIARDNIGATTQAYVDSQIGLAIEGAY